MSYFLSGWSSKYPSPKPKRNSGGKCQLSSCLYGIKFGEAGNPLSKSNFIKTSSKNAQKRCMAKLFLVSLKYKYTGSYIRTETGFDIRSCTGYLRLPDIQPIFYPFLKGLFTDWVTMEPSPAQK